MLPALRFLSFVAVFLTPLALTGCNRTPRPPDVTSTAPTETTDDCLVLKPPVGKDTLVVGLIEPVDAAHAPVPTNRAESWMFRNLYRGLVDVDCKGRVIPALAASWSSPDGGRTWRFKLSPDSRFGDGTEVLAQDVVDAWHFNRTAHAGVTGPWSWIHPDSLDAVDALTVRVALTHAVGNSPHYFAHPSLAVAKQGPGSWPLGTAGYTLEETEPNQRWSASPASGSKRTDTLIFFTIETGDARDLVPMGADLFWTQDPEALEYIRTNPDFSSTLLSWDRIYVLASPIAPLAPGPAIQELRADLIRDALSADARESLREESPDFWTRNCEPEPLPIESKAPSAATNRVVYPQGDPEAERIAERLVALALARRGETGAEAGDLSGLLSRLFPGGADDPPHAAPLHPDALLPAVLGGEDRAYLIPLHPGFPERCLRTASFRASLPWAGETRGGATALMTTGARLVWRNGVGGIRVGWDGIPRVNTPSGAGSLP